MPEPMTLKVGQAVLTRVEVRLILLILVNVLGLMIVFHGMEGHSTLWIGILLHWMHAIQMLRMELLILVRHVLVDSLIKAGLFEPSLFIAGLLKFR